MAPISSLASLKRGSHSCLIYENQQEQISATAQFLKIGLERRERCIFLGNPRKLILLRQALAQLGIDVVSAERSGQLQLSSDRLYLRNGRFDGPRSLQFLKHTLKETLKRHFVGLRITGDLEWEMGSHPDERRLPSYEKKLDSFVQKNKIVGLCQYSRKWLNARMIQSAIETHKTVILGDLFCPENLFYEPPKAAVKDKTEKAAKGRVEWLLAQIHRGAQQQNQRTEMHRQTEERFRAMVSEISDYAIYMMDPQGVITSWNVGAQRNKGYTESEILGKNFSIFYTPEEAQAGKPQKLLARAAKQGRAEDEGWRVRKDGRRFWANVVVTPLHDEQGDLIGFAKITRDMTERRATEEAMRRKNEELMQSRKIEAIGLLAGGIAHDFNNLLTGILGSVEILADSKNLNSDQKQDLMEIQKAGGKAMALTRQLLAFSRRQTISPKPLNLNAVINDLSTMTRRLLREDVGVVLHLYPALDIIQADRSQMDQVLLNLMVNARDAMPQGGTIAIETANIEVDTELSEQLGVDRGPYVRLTVSDTGTGMSEEVLSRIFEPFFTTKKEGQGTGLGLATVHGIVKQNKGAITVSSLPSHGTTFKIWLPNAPDTSRVDSKGAGKPSVEVPRGKESILIVEDEKIVAFYAAKVLRTLGYTVHVASNAQEALGLVGGLVDPVDLLLTDVILPETNGRQLADSLRAQSPLTKLLYMSGYPAEIIARHGVLNPGINFLEKPFNAYQLGRQVRDALDQKNN